MQVAFSPSTILNYILLIALKSEIIIKKQKADIYLVK